MVHEVNGNNIGRITPAGTSLSSRFPPRVADRRASPPGPTGTCGSPRPTATTSGGSPRRGTITEFPIPTADSAPYGIAAGPDGNLWFTEISGNNIGRITPAGTSPSSPIPTADSAPYGIAAGPDGNLWFTEISGNNIGRITPAGDVTEYPGPHIEQRREGHHSRAGREPVVRGEQRQQHRADHSRRGRHGVRGSHRG